jgi:hypothetical protein
MAVICQTPDQHCGAAVVQVNARMGKSAKAHGSSTEAFLCYKRYLVNVCGYTQIGGREFRPPDGGPILVLTKKIRYGARLRGGKQGRYQPDDPHFAGTIVG